MHRSMGSTLVGSGHNKSQANVHHRNGNQQGQQQHPIVTLPQHQHPLHLAHNSTSSAFGTHPADLNPMDFIEQDIIQSGGHQQSTGGGMIAGNVQHAMHQANNGGLVGPNFDVNLDAPFDMMSAFPDLDPSQFSSTSGGADGQHSPLLHQNIPGPMLGSSPMNHLIKNDGGMGMNNRNPQPHPNTPSNNSQQPLRQQQTNQNNNQNINHLSSQHQHHSHGGHPHISDYSPEWGWSDVSMALEELSKYCC